MNRYDSYKPTGIEWIGDIPEHWDVKKLKYVASINDEALSETTNEDFEIQYVDISSVQGGEIVAKEILKFKDAPSRARRQVKDGDIIVSTVRTYLKAITRIKNPVENLIVSTGFAVVRPQNIETNYLGNLFFSEHLIREIISRSTGVSYPAITASEVGQIEIGVPPKDEQISIANYLDQKTAQIDKLIANKQQLIELLKEERTAIINEAVTKNIEISELIKHARPSSLETSKGWKLLPLKFIVSTKITDGPHETPQILTEGVPFLSAESVKDGKINFESKRGFISKEQDLIYSKKCKPKRNDIFLVKSGSTTGRIAIVNCDDDFNIWSPLALIRTEDDILLSHLLYYILQSDYFQNQVKVSWSFGTQPNIGMSVIENLKVVFPINKEEQKSIISRIESSSRKINRTISKIETEVSLIQEYRTSLISEVVTGKIKVLDVPVTISIPSCQAALAAEIMQQLAEEKTFGRVKFQKILYLCEYSGQLTGMESNYQRAAAGPLDDTLLSTIEKELRALQWFDTASAPSKKFTERIVYSPLPKAAQYEKWYNKYWADSNENIQCIIGTLRFANTDTCEMIATLFAAWNDLIIRGFGQPSDDAIITEVYNWHIKKQRFPKPEWQKELSFMRKHHLIPTGFGKPTTTA